MKFTRHMREQESLEHYSVNIRRISCIDQFQPRKNKGDVLVVMWMMCTAVLDPPNYYKFIPKCAFPPKSRRRDNPKIITKRYSIWDTSIESLSRDLNDFVFRLFRQLSK
mmetsp:Transcript_8077/g.26717  ORF Transcript_8077/g.26717 Transcript_8077/m.26717 type:complete len:109 (+) Transcript_8077:3018-3344(+)